MPRPTRATLIAMSVATTLATVGLSGCVSAPAATSHTHTGSPSAHEHDGHMDGESMDGEHMDDGHMGHAMYEVSAAEAPAVSVTAHPESGGSFYIQLETERFEFTPADVDGAAVLGTGHAHIYVDGVKIARLYGPDYQLAGLASGEHVLRVTLNANDHSEYAVDGEVVAAEITVTVP